MPLGLTQNTYIKNLCGRLLLSNKDIEYIEVFVEIKATFSCPKKHVISCNQRISQTQLSC